MRSVPLIPVRLNRYRTDFLERRQGVPGLAKAVEGDSQQHPNRRWRRAQVDFFQDRSGVGGELVNLHRVVAGQIELGAR